VLQVRDVLKGDIRVIATTRPYGYSEEFDTAHYLHLTLQRLSSEKAASYARQWADAREPNAIEAKRIQDTFNMCLKDKVVSVLTQTPLQVTILLVIVRARGTPPKQREELFERYMDIIYQREQKKRPELLRTEQDIIYGLHKYLAYILHRRAEKDRTAALMEVSEFKEKVEEYLIHSNPLLNQEELEIEVKQIITEASQRLVLIESPQEGKIGFGLATTREFFAAAHLVDTAKDTKERDSRFKAIVRSPYWRNGALFFAGRVGRTRPGEAPSMIDVCRELDTEKVDKFIKRGSGMVMEMVDDRVLREPHNEIGAIQYGLELLDNRLIVESDEFLKKVKSLPDEYKERVIHPWMEERVKNAVPENLELYADIYQKLFGMSDALHNAIKRASEFDSEDIKLWALSEAIKNRIAELWVIELLEKLVDIVSIERIAWALGDYWSNFRFYLDFSLSPKARTAIALALLGEIEKHGPPFEPFPSKYKDELSMIKPEGKIKENSLLLWTVIQFLRLSHQSVLGGRYRRRDWSAGLSLPSIANPNVRAIVNKNASFIKDFRETFSKENGPLTNFLIAVFEFFLEPHNPEKYIDISKQLQEKKEPDPRLTSRVTSIFGMPPEDEEKLCEYHKEIYTLYEQYKSEEQYREDIEELNDLINRNSKKIKNHPHKLLAWIDYNFDPTIEKFLDQEILSEVKGWFQNRGLSGNACSLTYKRIISDLELCELVLEIIEKQLAERQKRLKVDAAIAFYEWHKEKTKQESTVAKRLKRIFEKVLANYSSLIFPEHRQLEILYWSALSAGIVEEKHMIELYSITHKMPHFLRISLYAREAENTRPTLSNMLQGENLEVARLAAISLLTISQRFFIGERRIIKEAWIGDKYWGLAKNKEDTWHPRYIEGMAGCELKWAEKGEEWLEAIKEANTEELEHAWCRVIEEAGYCEDKDRSAFFDLILHILESRDTFEKHVRIAALRRLHEIASEVEPIGFDEEQLNLPLSRRIRTSFS